MRSFLDLSSLLQEVWSFDPQGSVYPNRSLTPQQTAWNALAPGFIQACFAISAFSAVKFNLIYSHLIHNIKYKIDELSHYNYKLKKLLYKLPHYSS